MDKKKYLVNLIENNDNTIAFKFYDFFDATKRGAYFVLNYLVKHNKEVISADLSNSLNVSTARMTKLLQKLEKKNLILKQKSIADARKIIVTITEKGKKMLSNLKEMMLQLIDKLIEEIGEEKFEKFILLSSEIQNTINEKKLLDSFNAI